MCKYNPPQIHTVDCTVNRYSFRNISEKNPKYFQNELAYNGKLVRFFENYFRLTLKPAKIFGTACLYQYSIQNGQDHFW